MNGDLKNRIKEFARRGKSKGEILSELVHQGYNPDKIEAAMNSVYAISPISRTGAGKKIAIWAGGGIALVLILWGIWAWYENQPRVVADKALIAVRSAESFSFSVQTDNLAMQGIVVGGEEPAFSLRIEPDKEIAFPPMEIIQKNRDVLFIKVGSSNELSQYAWIETSPELFFENAHVFGLDDLSRHAGILRNFSKHSGSAFADAVEEIMRSPVQKSSEGIYIAADTASKRRLAELVLGMGDIPLLDGLSSAPWYVEEIKGKGYKEYAVRIGYKNTIVLIGNFGLFNDIPFDAIVTPFDRILIWKLGSAQ